MNTFKGRVEIFNTSGRVHYPVEVLATSWTVAANRAVRQALTIYRANRKGKRNTVRSIVVDLTDILSS